MKEDTIFARFKKKLKRFPKNSYFILIISAVFLILVLGASIYAVIFRQDLLKGKGEEVHYLDGNIDLVLESTGVSANSSEMKVALSIYPEAANPINVGVVIFKYDDSKIKLSGGGLRDLANNGLPDTNQFILHNVADFTGGTFVESKNDEVCATAGYVCFTLAYVKDTKFSVESDEQKGVLADLIFVPADGNTFSNLEGESLNFSFVQDKTSLGKLEGAYDNVDFNDLTVKVEK